MSRYFLPITTLIPDDLSIPIVSRGQFELITRKWDVSVFDWAELSTEHQVSIPWTAADAMLKSCNMEISVEEEGLEEAARKVRSLHAMLYAHQVHPFSVQMISDYSINQYAGINARKGSLTSTRLPEGLREGITSRDSNVSIWPAPYASMVFVGHDQLRRKIDSRTFEAAVDDLQKWETIRKESSFCAFLEDVLLMAPAVPHTEQSVLHIWTGLEALFPQVQTEVSFRIALYLAQLQQMLGDRRSFFQRARRSYQDRSRIAHGSKPKIKGEHDPWLAAWLLLIEIVQAIIARGKVPSEEELVEELLGVSAVTAAHGALDQ